MSREQTLAEKLQSITTPWVPETIRIWDFPREMLRLYELSDAKGMIELYEAYRNLTSRAETTETEAQKIFRAQKNLDIASIAANLMLEGYPVVEAMDKASKELASFPIVNVRKFYQDSIGYNPQTL